MALSVAYKSNSLMKALPVEEVPKTKPVKVKQKSLFTIAREAKFKKMALKKFESDIAEIEKYIPGFRTTL